MRRNSKDSPAWWLQVSLIIVAILLPLRIAYGQGSEALLTGTIIDANGGVLPGATVTARNQETGVEHAATTDTAGRYRIPRLRPGRYDITADLAGFEKVTQTSIVLTIGQEAIIDFKLAIKSLQESVTVEGMTPIVDVTKSEVSTGVSGQQIQNLPVNTREWINLAMLTPGVSQDNIRGFYNNANVGGGTRWYSNAFVVDGVTNTWAEMGEPRQNFGMDAISEFKVTESLFKAEYGLATGGLLTAVTKSGTNQFRGSGFLYARDKALNAKGHFEQTKPDFQRYQFGGTFGGPIVRNRSHFFFSYERTNLDQFYTVNTRGAFPIEEGTFPQQNHREMITVRGDHQINSTQSLAVRYAQENERQERIGAGGAVTPGFTQTIPRRSLVVIHSWVPSQTNLNELRAQYAYSAYQIWPGDSPTDFTENGSFDADRFNALNQIIVRPSLSKGFGWADVGPETRLEVKDDFTHFVRGWGGEHTLKTGFDYSWVDFKEDWSGQPRGTYFFSTDRAYNSADPTTFPYLFSAFGPEPLLAAAQTGTFPVSENTALKTQYLSAYVQDDWKPTSRLTFNLGLRYDLQTGVWNKDLSPTISPFIQPDQRGADTNFGPRTGFAWDVTADRKTVVRGGYGLYYDNVRTLIMFNERRNYHYVYVNVPNPGYPDPFGGKSFLDFAAGGKPSLVVNANDLRNPYAHQFGLGVTRQLAQDLALSVDFSYNHGLANFVQRDINYFLTPADRRAYIRPNSAFDRITEEASIGESKYRALLVHLDKRFSKRYQFVASYTLAKSEDDNPDALPADHFDVASEWGAGQTDRLQRLVLSGIVVLPYQIQLTAIADLRSSLPFNVVAGKDLNGDTIGGDRPPGITRNTGCRSLDLEAVNAYRTANGLSTVSDSDIVCAGFANVDFRTSKMFVFSGARNLELVFQVFNLFNRTNLNTLSQGQTAFGLNGNALSASFGQALSALPPRQIELAVRVRF